MNDLNIVDFFRFWLSVDSSVTEPKKWMIQTKHLLFDDFVSPSPKSCLPRTFLRWRRRCFLLCFDDCESKRCLFEKTLFHRYQINVFFFHSKIFNRFCLSFFFTSEYCLSPKELLPMQASTSSFEPRDEFVIRQRKPKVDQQIILFLRE